MWKNEKYERAKREYEELRRRANKLVFADLVDIAFSRTTQVTGVNDGKDENRKT